MARVYIGIGSNLGDSAGAVRDAFDRLRTLGTHYVNSDLYLTEPWGKTDQPAFINAVAAFDTDARPAELLQTLRGIERDFGRVRVERWGPRTMDFDLLLYGDLVVDKADLAVPHPHLRERAFVLAPLGEIAPYVRIPPKGERPKTLLENLAAEERAGARRLRGTATLSPPPHVDYDAPGGAGERYANLRPFSPFDRAVLEAVLAATGPLAGKRVLDVGCGTGRFTEKLAEAGARVTGLDRSATMLAGAREAAAAAARQAAVAANDIEYVQGDANVALPAGWFDAITAFYCSQYLDVATFARRARPCLNANGTLALATFPHSHFAEIEFAQFFPSLPAIDMGRFPSVQAVERALRSAGFDDVGTRDLTVVTSDEPAALIERVEQRYLSSFHLLPEEEFREGLDAMRRAWQGQDNVSRTARAVVISGRNGAAEGR